MKQLFRGQNIVRLHEFQNVPKEVIEKHFIMEFFEHLPIDALKELINFEVMDFRDNQLWESPRNLENLKRLSSENSIHYSCELYLEIKEKPNTPVK